MTPAEVRMLDNRYALLFIRRERPVMDFKYDILKHPSVRLTTDMRMPEMDGLEATRRIRAMDRADAKNIPIIALTANAFDEDVQRSMQAGLNAHLSKPVEPDVLFETLEGLLRTVF